MHRADVHDAAEGALGCAFQQFDDVIHGDWVEGGTANGLTEASGL
jgi:hypothetical protein